ncbi:MAG: ABC transporter permease [Melioribacteraceae bacterium]|nr:ABC transporter permease [Melioribacteraceae bacterium]
MFENYIKTAWRQLLKYKVYSFIKIVGLGISTAFCILVMLFVKNEFTFDGFHNDADRIFRVEEDINLERAKSRGYNVKMFSNGEDVSRTSMISPAVGPAMEEEIPEVIASCRYTEERLLIKTGNNLYHQDVQLADKNFFDFFSFKLIAGENKSVLDNPSSCVLTRELAEKYHGGLNSIGKIIEIKLGNELKPFLVTGIAELPPSNSSITYSVIIPLTNNSNLKTEEANLAALTTTNFIKLSEDFDLKELNKKVGVFSRRKLAGIFGNGTFEETNESRNITVSLDIVNIRDIYLSPHTMSREKSANPLNAYILIVSALLIMIVACTNYISIALASASDRSLEVGIRKVMGANQNSLTMQFLSEALLVSFISILIGTILAESLLPLFNDITGGSLSVSLLNDSAILLLTILLALLIGFLSGIYPAFIMSHHKTVKAINRSYSIRYKTKFILILVGFQFAVFSFLITSAVIMASQMSLVNNRDLGYDPVNIVTIPLYGSEIGGNTIVKRLRNELAGKSDFRDVSGASLSFGSGMSMTMLNINSEQIWSYYYFIDFNFIPMMNIDLIEGRNFHEEKTSDRDNAVIINETLARRAGIKHAGEIISSPGNANPYTVIGIAKDFNFQSLLNEVNPMFLESGGNGDGYNYAFLKVDANRKEEAISAVKSIWSSIAPDIPFEYNFLEETLDSQYGKVIQWQNVINTATVFAVVIAVLGLFGIAGIQAVNKTKEIGIRKVLGAGMQDIMYMVNKNIFITAVTAFIIAFPVSVFVTQNWLDKFAYRISITAEIFALTAAISFLTALITVAFHSIRASLINPVESIKTE